MMKEMVDRFLAWPLPASVRADSCTTEADYPHPRSGTNLLTATEAEQMLEHVAGPVLTENALLRSLLQELVEAPYGREYKKALERARAGLK